MVGEKHTYIKLHSSIKYISIKSNFSTKKATIKSADLTKQKRHEIILSYKMFEGIYYRYETYCFQHDCFINDKTYFLAI